MKEKLEFFRIGKIVKTRGLKGDIKVYSHTDDIERFLELEYFYIGKDRDIKYKVERVNIIAPNMVTIKILGYDTIESVQEFIQKYMYVDRENSYKLEDDEMFIVDMIGLKAYTEEGMYLGKLIDVLQYTANDVYVIKSDEGKEYLIPATYEIVPEINIDENRMIIHPIKGLLE